MKKVILYTLLSFVVSCANKDDYFDGSQGQLLSQWKLIAMYTDPGDGSGDFETVSSNKIISFYSDNVILSNGDLCIMGTNTTDGSFGTFTIGTTNTIMPSSCAAEQPFSMTFVIENSILLIYYTCIEACVEKYELIEQ